MIFRNVASASSDVTRHTTPERVRKAARRQSQTYARKSTTLSLLLDRNNRRSHLPASFALIVSEMQKLRPPRSVPVFASIKP